MSEKRGAKATVLQQEEGRVRVDHQGEERKVPLAGFPPGFQLRPGERVAVVNGPAGAEARPLVQAVRTRVSPDALRRRGDLEVGSQKMTMQEATVVHDPGARKEDREPGEYLVWVVDPGRAEGPSQVVAVRRAEPSA